MSHRESAEPMRHAERAPTTVKTGLVYGLIFALFALQVSWHIPQNSEPTTDSAAVTQQGDSSLAPASAYGSLNIPFVHSGEKDLRLNTLPVATTCRGSIRTPVLLPSPACKYQYTSGGFELARDLDWDGSTIHRLKSQYATAGEMPQDKGFVGAWIFQEYTGDLYSITYAGQVPGTQAGRLRIHHEAAKGSPFAADVADSAFTINLRGVRELKELAQTASVYEIREGYLIELAHRGFPSQTPTKLIEITKIQPGYVDLEIMDIPDHNQYIFVDCDPPPGYDMPMPEEPFCQ